MVRKLVYIAIGCIIVGIIGFGVFFQVFGLSKPDGKSTTRTLNGQSISQVMIQSNSTDVRLSPSSSEHIIVSLKGRGNNSYLKNISLDVKKANHKVKVLVKQKRAMILNFGWNHVVLDVKVPKKIYENLQIDSSSGDINIDDIYVKSAHLTESSGDLNLRNTTISDTAKIKATSGDLNIQQTKAYLFQITSSSGDMTMTNSKGSIKSNSTSGDTTIKNHTITGPLTSQASSGDVTILLNNTTSLSLNYKGSSGDGTSIIKNMNYQEKSDSRIIGKTGEGKFPVNVITSSGDFYIGHAK